MKDEIKKTNLSLTKKGKQANSGEFSKSRLIFQTRNPWNPTLGLNQEVKFPTNLIEKNKNKKNEY